jgi:putative ABC transport system permease protein
VIISALDRKLLRDLIAMWGQGLAIAAVICSGVATYVMSISTYDSLRQTQQNFYQDYRLADVFASLKRAPERLAARIAEIPGVDQLETRVVAQANIDVDSYAEPVSGLLISVPDDGAPLLNRLHLRAGRPVSAGRHDEVVISELFAQAHDLQPGDSLSVIINGHRQTLNITGIALSPEHIFIIQPGALFPDNNSFGVLWMGRSALATAYDMEGAFNDVTLTLFPGAPLQPVLAQLDELLKPYGGLGSYGREEQLSHRYLSSELNGLRAMAAIFPVIFLGVATFLLNVVIARLISLQREQIAALKAFGYRNHEIGWHYLKLVSVIVLIGVLLGIGFGVWMGHGMSAVYMQLYRFPALTYQLRPLVVLSAIVISIIAATLGTLQAVYQAVRLPPAEAMRPEAPARYRETWPERLGLKNLLSQPARMILRNLQRRPLKALLSIVGIALACAVLVLGSFQEDSVDYMVTVQFSLSQRDDLSVAFVEPTAKTALYELGSLPGVTYGEPFRSVAVRLRYRQHSYRTAIQGLPENNQLQRLLDTDLDLVRLPQAGVLLSDYLAGELGVQTGDYLQVEVLEGKRPLRELPVAGVVKQYIGVAAYMEIGALNRLLDEGDSISGAALLVERPYLQTVYRKLKQRPRVAATTIKENAVRSFYETMGENILVFAFINTLLAATIAFGVVYNSARIALSERSRELASLRVLGFTRSEVAYILLGELALLTLLAIPLGFAIGRGLCALLVTQLSSDLYQIPLVTEPSTYAFAASIVLAASLVSGWLIWRKLARLDLVGVLKTRE